MMKFGEFLDAFNHAICFGDFNSRLDKFGGKADLSLNIIDKDGQIFVNGAIMDVQVNFTPVPTPGPELEKLTPKNDSRGVPLKTSSVMNITYGK